MKIRPLPELDIARIAMLPPAQQRPALELMKNFPPPYTYHPLRYSELDICNIEPGPFGAGPRTPWGIIKENIWNASTKPEEANANLRAAEALYSFADENKISGRRYVIPALPVGISEKVIYWCQAVVSINGIATVIFVDPRKTPKLSADGRRFVFSMMRERINAYEDFSNVQLGIIQFQNPRGSLRVAQYFTDEGIDLIAFRTLDAMVRQTYKLWYEVLEERAADARRRGGPRGALGL